MAKLWLTASDTIDPGGVYTQSAIETASEILFKLSGEKYPGISTVTDCYTSEVYTSVTTTPVLIAGNVYNIPNLDAGVRNLRLRHSPVNSIQEVRFDGILLDSSEYELRNKAYIVKKNKTPWIMDSVHDLCVTYSYGTPPPSAGKKAAIRLANELILADKGSSQCALPERITSVSRQGVSYTVLDPQSFLENGRVGIYEVDLFLSAFNPSKAKKKARVFSVDRPRGERIN